jgi:hypothetical protein
MKRTPSLRVWRLTLKRKCSPPRWKADRRGCIWMMLRSIVLMSCATGGVWWRGASRHPRLMAHRCQVSTSTNLDHRRCQVITSDHLNRRRCQLTTSYKFDGCRRGASRHPRPMTHRWCNLLRSAPPCARRSNGRPADGTRCQLNPQRSTSTVTAALLRPDVNVTRSTRPVRTAVRRLCEEHPP